MIGRLKSNWRVVMLVVFVLVAGFALFAPTGGADESAAAPNGSSATQITNLRYGLDLAGGTRIEAPLVGLTATDVAFGDDSTAQVAAQVAAELPDTETTDVIARQATADRSSTVEVVNPNITETQFGTALDAAGYEYGGIRSGVTDATGEEAISVLRSKVNEAGLSGATVQESRVRDQQFYVQIEVPGESYGNVTDLIEDRGNVRVDIYYQNDSGGYETERSVLTRNDFQSISTATRDDRIGPHVPVTVRQSSAEEFQQVAVETGVAQTRDTFCDYYDRSSRDTEACLLLVVDDEVVNAFGMDGGLGQRFVAGDWVRDSSFVLTTTSYSEAQSVAVNLRAGALPAPLGTGEANYISPTQGENFQFNSLIVGILAVLAVAGVVFLRYREPKVALPMVLTAFSEVVILLGFAAYLGYPLDLAVIAGFIAVIGTGVDDLIIIADEVMSEGEVSSQRVFDSRFRRAFWVIGVAAATTIIAMSPLAVLELGNLRGFAIFTILGVLVGVLITRPAYGDILRYLMTDR